MLSAPGLFSVGRKHTIEFTRDDETGCVVARCRGAQVGFQNGPNWCDFLKTFPESVSLEDAIEQARDHADMLRS